MRLALVSALLVALALPATSEARGSRSSGSHATHSHRSTSRTRSSGGAAYRSSGTVQRGHDGRIRRSSAAKAAFRRSHPCPATGRSTGACPGYVVDHVKALKRGGADDPSNMQWQTLEAAKAKDRWE